ncbi:hypothetical protein PCE1_003765 [Barthelona sp. PCE]
MNKFVFFALIAFVALATAEQGCQHFCNKEDGVFTCTKVCKDIKIPLKPKSVDSFKIPPKEMTRPFKIPPKNATWTSKIPPKTTSKTFKIPPKNKISFKVPPKAMNVVEQKIPLKDVSTKVEKIPLKNKISFKVPPKAMNVVEQKIPLKDVSTKVEKIPLKNKISFKVPPKAMNVVKQKLPPKPIKVKKIAPKPMITKKQKLPITGNKFHFDLPEYPLCPICESGMQSLYEYIKTQGVIQKLDDYVMRICEYVGDDKKLMCKSIVQAYVPQLIDIFENSVTPKAACGFLSLCPKQVKLQLTETPSCSICEFIVSTVEHLLADVNVEQMITQAAVSMCTHLPSQYTGLCLNFVNTYVPALIEQLEGYLSDPEAACSAVKLC